MTLGLTQPLAEMSTRNISWGVKAAGAQGWQSYHLNVPTVLKSESLKLLEPSGPVQACNGTALPFSSSSSSSSSSGDGAGGSGGGGSSSSSSSSSGGGGGAGGSSSSSSSSGGAGGSSSSSNDVYRRYV